MKMIIKARPNLETTNVPKSKCLKFFHKLVTNPVFEISIMVCIVLNML